MGCRKNAYRALTELSEWMEEEKKKAEIAAQALQEAQRHVWKPPEIYEDCCPPWLVHGPEIRSIQKAANSAVIKGCSGGCGKAHPCITLHCSKQDNGATATLSHALDRFVYYFEYLCTHGLAKKKSNKSYQLNGFLQFHLDRMKKQATFRMHLVKVSPSDLAASQRAHARHMEQLDVLRQCKRQKMAPANVGLLQAVLEICYQHSLPQLLDIADIAWMRLACKSMGKIAARMAQQQMEMVNLSYSLLLNGSVTNLLFAPSFRGNKVGAFTQEQVGSCIFLKVEEDEPQRRSHRAGNYEVHASHVSLQQQEAGIFVPLGETLVNWVVPLRPSGRRDGYKGHIIRVFLEHANPLLAGVEIARHRLSFESLEQPGHRVSNNFVWQSQGAQRHQITQANVEEWRKYVYKGSFTIQQFQFTFNDLLGIFVRKKLPLARSAMQKKHGPVSRTEKQYVKNLAKAAREAPGNARDYDGFEGW